MKNHDFDAEKKADELLEMLGKELGESRARYMERLLAEIEAEDSDVEMEFEASEPVITKGSRHPLRRIIILAAVLIAIMGMALVSSEAVRLKLSSLFFKDSPVSTRIVDEVNAIDVTKVKVGYVPEGFKLVSDEMPVEGYRIVGIQSTEDEVVMLTIVKTEKYTYDVDNEYLDVDEIMVNDKQGYTFEENGQNIVLWQIGDTTLQITSSLGEELLLEIAENVYIE